MSEQPQSLKRLRERLGGIETEVMNGDNLAIVLCSFFDDGEESEDDTNWSPAAIAGCNQVLEAIHQYYAAALSAHLAPAQSAPVLREVVAADSTARERAALALREAFIAGATAVHEEWIAYDERGEGAPRGNPDFTEAASDYAALYIDTGASATLPQDGGGAANG